MTIKIEQSEFEHAAFPKNLKIRNPMVYQHIKNDGLLRKKTVSHKRKFDDSDNESTIPRTKSSENVNSETINFDNKFVASTTAIQNIESIKVKNSRKKQKRL